MNDVREVTELWEDYQHGLSYQSSTGLSKNIPKFIKFYEGNQWAPPTKNTKNLPRPVVNIIKMICRNKKSAILSTPVKIIYKSESESANVDRFNRFAEYIQKELDQENLDKLAIKDGVTKGTYIYHYYWDADAKGKRGLREGGVRCEIIDPLNIFFSNPRERDEQKQKWIIISSREDVDSVRAKCDSDVDKNMICSDDSDEKYGTVEQEGNKLVTVLTRYFRKNGEVYFEKATKSTVINKPQPLAPDMESAGRELGIDAPNNSLPDSETEEDLLVSDETRASLYPIVVGNYDTREGSIFGIGEIEGIIPNQKAINFNIAMSLLNSQETAWGKYIVLPTALKGQTINNEPGQVLVDHTGTGQGIRKMTEQAMQSQPLQLVESLTQLTRVMTGANEVMTGEVIGANMSGAAIAALQSQAQQPIEELRDTFWLVKKKQGRVLIQFFKLFYEEREFTYKDSVPQTDENGQMLLDGMGIPIKKEATLGDVFYGSEYKDVDFEVVVETISGTKSSSAGDINALDILFSKGAISLKTYLNAYPEDALSNKSEILKGIEEDEQSQAMQMQAQIQQLTAELEQAKALISEQEKTVENAISAINENARLKQTIVNLYGEADRKIRYANDQINQNNRKIQEVVGDATFLAQRAAEQTARESAPISI